MDRTLRRPLRAGALVAALALVTSGLVLTSAGSPGAASSPESEAAADLAVAYLASTQDASGGWDGPSPSCSFLFNTYDAALAIAEAGQTGPSWSASQARAAIAAVSTGGKDAFDAIDAAVGDGSGCSTGKIAQLVILAVATDDGSPGASPSAWDPAGDGDPIDLAALLGDGGPDGSFGSIYSTWIGVVARRLLGASTADLADSLEHLRANQNTDGGFGGFGSDTDTTGGSIMGLVAAGASATDPAVTAALAYLREQYQPDGSFDSGFGTISANSTAFAMLGITAAGYDTTSSCWRDPGMPPAGPYTSPDAYLRSIQVTSGPDAGKIASPDDFSGIFATAQAVQGLLRSWLPRTIAPGALACAGSTQTVTTPGGEVTITTSLGHLVNVTSAPLPPDGPLPPAGVAFPYGLIGFEITRLSPGTTVTVTLTLPGPVDEHWKFQQGVWSRFSATIASGTVTLTLVDGGPGDDDGTANGTIVDPGAPGVALRVTFTG